MQALSRRRRPLARRSVSDSITSLAPTARAHRGLDAHRRHAPGRTQEPFVEIMGPGSGMSTLFTPYGRGSSSRMVTVPTLWEPRSPAPADVVVSSTVKANTFSGKVFAF